MPNDGPPLHTVVEMSAAPSSAGEPALPAEDTAAAAAAAGSSQQATDAVLRCARDQETQQPAGGHQEAGVDGAAEAPPLDLSNDQPCLQVLVESSAASTAGDSAPPPPAPAPSAAGSQATDAAGGTCDGGIRRTSQRMPMPGRKQQDKRSLGRRQKARTVKPPQKSEPVDLFQHVSSDSVYVQIVKLLSDGPSLRQRFTATWALATVLLLQLALVIMLLYASANQDSSGGSAALTPGPIDYLQLQMRLLQLQMCTLQAATHPTGNSSSSSSSNSNNSSNSSNSSVGLESCPDLLALLNGQHNSSTEPPWMSAGTMQSAYEAFAANKTGNQSAAYEASKSGPQAAGAFPAAVVFQPRVEVAGTGQRVLVVCFATTSLLVLAVFVAVELLEACELAYVVLLLGGRLPKLMLRTHHCAEHLMVRTCLRDRRFSYVIAAALPVLQCCVCCGVFAAGVMLMVRMKFSTDLVQIIINSVALSFVLEIDNKVGQLLQREVRPADQAGSMRAPAVALWTMPVRGFESQILLQSCWFLTGGFYSALTISPFLVYFYGVRDESAVSISSSALMGACAGMAVGAHFGMFLIARHHPFSYVYRDRGIRLLRLSSRLVARYFDGAAQ